VQEHGAARAPGAVVVESGIGARIERGVGGVVRDPFADFRARRFER